VRTRAVQKADDVSTREHLLVIAEKLFAQFGIDAVSTRQIAATAAQRNSGALHYHFGSKDQLIDALLALRLKPINRRREALMTELRDERRERDLHALLAVLVVPLIETLEDPHNHFVGCLHQLYLGERGERVYAHLPSELTSGLDAVGSALEARLRSVPAPERHRRLSLMAVQVVYSAAVWYYQRERGTLDAPLASLSATSVDFLGGALLATTSTPRSRGRAPARRRSR